MKKAIILTLIGIPLMMFCFFVGVYWLDKLTDFFDPPKTIYQLKYDILDGDMDWKWQIGTSRFYMCCREITRDKSGHVRIKVEFVSQDKRLPPAPRDW